MSFNERFAAICKRKKSHVCVGLDVDLNKIPDFLKGSEDAAFQFSRAIIDATQEHVAAYKINIAFFEAYGVSGWRVLEMIADYLPKDVIRIADAKRGDIGNTSRMYARAFLEELPFDAVTVNPYLGIDSVAPFIEESEKGVFVLCLTSNKSAADFQYKQSDGRQLYEDVAVKTMEWNGRDNCGLVVGATKAGSLGSVRSLAPSIPFLIPGIGAQGGDLALSLKNVFIAPSDKAVINSSRGIIYASSEEDFAEVAARKAEILKNEINDVVSTLFTGEDQ